MTEQNKQALKSAPNSTKDSVLINEVGLRDGLQNQPRMIDTNQKLRLANALIDSGLRSLEVTSFVHPKAVPQMADAADVLKALPASAARYTVLVPNLKGFELALANGAQHVGVVVAATDTFNQGNIKMSTAQAMTVCKEVIAQAKNNNCSVRAYVSTVCECPFDGVVNAEQVHKLVDQFVDFGADEISIADTTGAGNPGQLKKLMKPLVAGYGADIFNLHLHDTRGMALANAWAGLELGLRNFDASIAGLGGCPFSPGASGNLATEDLVFMLEQSGFDTGVDFEKLVAAVAVAEDICQQSLGGKIMPWWRNQQAKKLKS